MSLNNAHVVQPTYRDFDNRFKTRKKKMKKKISQSDAPGVSV